MIHSLSAFTGANQNEKPYETPPCDEYEHNDSDIAPLAGLTNFVDERYELVALAFRLAESRIPIDFPDHVDVFAPAMAFYNDETDYMRLLNFTFGKFVRHPIVEYIIYLWTNGYYPMSNDVFSMAVHLEKIGEEFVLTDNISGMIMPKALNFNTWTEANAYEFVKLLNNFYRDTNFSQFFQEHIGFFIEISTQLTKQVVNDINLEWFEQHGLSRDNLRIVLSPSKSRLAFGATLYNTSTGEWIAHAGLPLIPPGADINRVRSLIVHEFSHAFSNPIAETWYAENDEFRGWVHNTLLSNEQRMFQQGYGLAIVVAYEYVTRAHEILYMAENTNANLWRLLAVNRFIHGFTYIEHVYAMVTDHTPMLHIIISAIIIVAVLLIVVLPATMLWRKRRRLK
jgi:hypothetical protein